MAVPSYTTDLTNINLIEAGTSFTEFSGYTLGGPPTNDTDYYIQGSGCGTTPLSNKTGLIASIGIDYGSDLSGSFAAGDCVFMWQVMLAGNAMDSFANGGIRILIGTNFTNFDGWKTGGNDFGRNPYGGWQNIAVDPTYTADYTGGTGNGGAYQTFGSALNMVSGIQKGNLHGMDAIRYGRGELIIEFGALADGYGTFAGINTQNDSSSNRWGLLKSEGTGYLWKGLMSFGNTTNACEFTDSNINITIDDTPRTYATFNKIEITNASSVVDWTNIFFTAVNSSQLSPGSFEMINDATVDMLGCSFTDMTTFIFDSNATIDTTTFRRCGLVTQAGGTFTDCVFADSTASASILADNLGLITGSTFESDGSNHAIELTSAHAGGTYALTGCTFTSYATSDGSTGNEVIYNNSGGAVTINSSGNTGTISVRNGTSASTTVNNNVILELNGVVQNTQCYIVPTAGGAALMNEAASEVVSGDQYKATENYDYSTDVAVTVRTRELGYLPFETSGTVDDGGLTVTAVWQIDPNFKLVVTGVSITFNNLDPDTIVRSSGNFATDGWIGVMSQVTIEGSTSNDGTYEIASIATDTITLEGTETLTGGTDATGATLTYTRRDATW